MLPERGFYNMDLVAIVIKSYEQLTKISLEFKIKLGICYKRRGKDEFSL